ncbi:MAG: hypothetical protein J5644_01605 [Bacteroidales bacterium]|nr:hypothetical protein [Bacteroidales bacterium]
MKKLTLIPKTDTITICLPPDWVGQVVVCTLSSPAEENNLHYAMAAEKNIPYSVPKKRGRPKKSV